MQILTVLIYCFYRQLLIQHASRNVESVYSQSSYPTHSHLCGLDLTVPLVSLCSTCQREKV